MPASAKLTGSAKRRTTVDRNKRRSIDRLHKCECCPEIYYCEPCSETATRGAQSFGTNSALYKENNVPHRFVCPDCRRKRRKPTGPRTHAGRPRKAEGSRG